MPAGAFDLPSGEQPPNRPVTLLATAVPRLITLAVAANVLHVLPAAAERAPVADDLLSTLDLTAAGSLHRCHLALDADANARDYQTEDWLPLVYDQATHALLDASADRQPSLPGRARTGGRPLGRSRDRLARPRHADRTGSDLRLPLPPPRRLRVR